MKKIRSRLSLVLLLILSMAVMIGATASMLVSADTRSSNQPAVVEVYSDDWYEITITDNSLTILLDTAIGSYRSVSRDDLSNIKQAAVSAIKTIIIEQILNQGGVSGYSAVRSAMPIAQNDALDNLKAMYGRYKSYLTERLSMLQEMEDGSLYAVEMDKFIHGEYDALIEYAAARYINDDVHASDVELADLIQKAHNEVLEVIGEVLAELVASGEDIVISGPRGMLHVTEETLDEVLQMAEAKLDEIDEKLDGNEGQMDITIADLLDLLKGVTIGGYEVYNGNAFVLNNIKQLIAGLPKFAEIANWSDDQMNLSYNIAVQTSLGDVNFRLTVGFKGDATNIRKVAKFIADHISFTYDENTDTYTLDIQVPDEFAALALKLSNTTRIPDEIKHAVFGMFDKTGDEIFDKATSYSYDQIINYLKGKDFQGLFAGLLDAQRVRDYFARYGVDLSKITDARIDKLIDTIIEYVGKLANKQTVENVEEFLREYGIAGIPAYMEEAVQKFLNLLNKFDYNYWNAETFKEFLNNKTLVNEKYEALLARLATSATTEKLYNKLIEYAEKVFKYVPDVIHNGTILGLYEGNGEMVWEGNINYDIKEILTKIVDKLVPYAEKAGIESAEEYAQYIDDILEEYFEGEMTIDVNLSLHVTMPDIYKVEYIVNDTTIGAGLLPVGADVVFYANATYANGRQIIAWIDEDGTEYTKMPEKDVKLYAVTDFEANITVESEIVTDIQKIYDGQSVVLTVDIIGAVGANPTFTWFKDGEIYTEIVGMTGATLELVNVAHSGTYYCVVENAYGNFNLSAQTQEVEVAISPATLDVEVAQSNEYNGVDNKPEITVTGVNGEVLAKGVDYTVTYKLGDTTVTEVKNVGIYTVIITLNNTDLTSNYVAITATWEYEITAAELAVEVEESNEYTGLAQEPAISVTGVNGEVLAADVDYEVTYYLNGEVVTEVKNVGVYTVEITLKDTTKANNYVAITATWEYEITAAELAVEVEESNEYSGLAQEPAISVTGVNGEVLAADVDYEVIYYLNGEVVTEVKNVGVYTVEITLKDTTKANNYAAITATWEYEITAAELAVEVEESNEYTGLAQEPAISVTGVNNEVLAADVDYEVTYYLNGEVVTEVKNVGVYTVEITLKDTTKANNYAAITATWEYEITAAELAVEVEESNEYTGLAQEPAISVTGVNNEVLAKGVDYTVTYKLGDTTVTEVKNVGIYTVIITLNNTDLTSNYVAITATWEYEITAAELNVTVEESNEYTGLAQEPAISVTGVNGEVLAKGVDFTVTYKLGDQVISADDFVNADTFTVILTLTNTEKANNYRAISRSYEYVITKVVIELPEELAHVTYDYTKDEQLAAALATMVGVNNEVLVVGVDYTVTYTNENGDVVAPKNAGDYTVTVTLNNTALASNYELAEYDLTFTIDKAELDFSNGTWTPNPSNFEYTGSEQVVEFVITVPGDVTVNHFDNRKTAAGNYQAYITVEYDTNNYDIINLPAAYSWSIVKQTFDISSVVFELYAYGEDDPVELDDDEHVVIFNNTEYKVEYRFTANVVVPAEVAAAIEGALAGVWKATNAGVYQALIQAGESANYMFGEISWNWEVAAATITVRADWDYESTKFLFDGREHGVELVGYTITDGTLFQGYALVADNNKHTDPGEYAAVVVAVDSNNNATNNIRVITLNPFAWVIESPDGPIDLDFSGYSWTESEFTYDGIGKTITLVNEAGEDVLAKDWDLYYGYSLQYFYALKGDATNYYEAVAIIDAGEYIVFIAVVGPDGITNVYNIVLDDGVNGTQSTPNDWTIAQAVLGQNIVVPTNNVFNAAEHVIEVTLTDINDNELVAGVDYNVIYTDEDGEVVERLINAGTYTVTIELLGDIATNYVAIESFTYTIAKAAATVSVADDTIFNGEAQAPAITVMGVGALVEETDYIVTYVNQNGEGITADEVKNAGTYTITIELIGLAANNYALTESTFTYVIEKAVVDMSGEWSPVDGMVYNYDGTTKYVMFTFANGEPTAAGASISFVENTGIFAGDYFAYIVLTLAYDAANYDITYPQVGSDAGNPYEWSIAQAVLIVEGADESVTYNGEAQPPVITVTGVDGELEEGEDYEVTYELYGAPITADQIVNVNKYTVIITLKGDATTNYQALGTYIYEITKATLIIEVDPESTEYNGEAQAPVITVTGVSGDLVENTHYTVTFTNGNGEIVTADQLINAGTYTIAIELLGETADNYNAVKDRTFTITKVVLTQVDIELIVTQDGEVKNNPEYNGRAYSVSINYYTNYSQAEFAEYFNIAQAAEGVFSATSAGSYYITLALELNDSTNYTYAGRYTVVGGIIRIEFNLEWEINARALGAIDGTWVPVDEDSWKVGTNNVLVFDGGEHSVAFIPDYDALGVSPDDFYIYYVGVAKATNVGTYTVAVRIVSRDGNYQLESELGEEFEWTIEAAVIDLTGYTWTASTNYTGSEQTITLKNAAGIDAESYALAEGYSLEYYGNAATNAGTYYAHIAVVAPADGLIENYIIVLGAGVVGDSAGNAYTWSIAKQTVAVEVEWVGNTVFEYDGATHGIAATLKDDTYASVSTIGGSEINAGEYTATAIVTLNDVDNYELNVVGELTKDWSINKKQITVTVSWSNKTEFTYEQDTTREVVATLGGDYDEYAEYVIRTDIGTFAAINAGEYYAGVELTLNDNNYELIVSGETVLTWSIAKKTVKVNVEWSAQTEFRYLEGTAQGIEIISITGEAAEMIDMDAIAYVDNMLVFAGNYAATATLTLKDEYLNNYELSQSVFTKAWSIAKKILEVEYSWNGDLTQTFNGTEQGITLSVTGIANGKVIISLENNKSNEVGKYIAVAKLSLTSNYRDNYELSQSTFMQAWEIVPGTIDLSEYEWRTTSDIYADGNEIEIKLVNKQTEEALPLTSWAGWISGYELKYVNNVQTKVGTYFTEIIVVDANGETANYVITGVNTQTAWSIAKKVIDVSVSWSTTTAFDYDGNAHGVTASVVVADEYKDLITVTPIGSNSAIEAGNYVAVVKLVLSDTESYVLSENVFTQSWKINPPVIEEPPVYTKTELVAEGGNLPEGVKVAVKASQPLPDGSQLVVALSSNTYTDDQFIPFVPNGTPHLVQVYSISITEIPEGYNGTFTVTITNSEFAGKDLVVVHIPLNADGTPVAEEQWSNQTYPSLSENDLTFQTPNFSDFAVVERISANDSQSDSSLWLLWALLAIIIILLVVIIVLMIMLLNKDEKDGDDNNEPQHPVVIIETIESEEENVEQVPAAEATEATVEEDDTAATLVAASEEADTDEYFIAEDGTRTIYDKSFGARLSQADDELKDFYSELKNYILSYKGVKSRISWHFDSYNKGREKCIKIQFRGKSMYMYIALPAAEMPEKFHVKDVSDKARYEDVPTMLRIRKPRSLKYAKVLVDMLMNKLGAEQGEIPNVKYRPRFRTTTSLIEMGLIKIKTTNSTFAAPKSNND